MMTNDIEKKVIDDYINPYEILSSMPHGGATILAVADKIDSLCGLMLIGERATSSGDPYALRKYALGIIMICNYQGSPKSARSINIIELVRTSLSIYQEQGKTIGIEEPEKQILYFIEERAKNYFKKEFDIKLVNAIVDFNINPKIGFIRYNLIALQHFLSLKKGQALLSCIKRISNILKNLNLEGEIKYKLLSKSGKALYKALDKIRLLGNFYTDFISMVRLIPKIIKLFDNTMIIDPDPKIAENNLRLLAKIHNIHKKIANFDCLM